MKFSTWEVFIALALGCEDIILSSEGHRDGKAYWKIKPFQKKEGMWERSLPGSMEHLNPGVPEAKDSWVFQLHSQYIYFYMYFYFLLGLSFLFLQLKELWVTLLVPAL